MSLSSGSASSSAHPSAGPWGSSPWTGHQTLEMLQGGCQLLLPAGLRSPEIHLFFLIGGLLLYNMVLVSLIHQHGSAVCVTCPPSRTSLPSRLSQSPCVGSLSHAAHSPHRLFYTSWCARFHATLSTRPTLSLASVSTSLLFMRDTRSVSPWAQCRPCGREPRGDAQGIRKETDSSPAPECGFPLSHPPSGRLSLSHHRPARLPGNKPLGASCLLGAPGSLGTVSSRACHHLQALGSIDCGQSSHSDGEQVLL